MAVKNYRVNLRVLETWINTLLGLFVIVVLAMVLAVVSIRYGGRVVILILGGWAIFGTLLSLFSEKIIVHVDNLQELDEERYPLVRECVDEICTRWWFFRTPRLYVIPRNDANACAFGFGFFGQYAVAVTSRLYEILDKDELKAVIAHEIGHIRSRDTGLFCALLILTGGFEYVARWLFFRQTLTPWTILRGIPALIIAGVCFVFAKLIFPMTKIAVSKEREYAADALAAKYCGSKVPLQKALRTICSKGDLSTDVVTVFLDALLFSHPGLESRISALDEYED